MYAVANDIVEVGFQGARLRFLREKEQLSQPALAEKLEVNQQEISAWEVGKAPPDTKNVLKIVRFFKVRPDFLFNIADDWKLETASAPSSQFQDDLAAAVTVATGLTKDDLDKLEEIITRLRDSINK